MSELRRELLELLERGLQRLARLRKFHGAHPDFDRVESHQRRLIEAVQDDSRPIPEELRP